jgi:hypothetical protein
MGWPGRVVVVEERAAVRHKQRFGASCRTCREVHQGGVLVSMHPSQNSGRKWGHRSGPVDLTVEEAICATKHSLLGVVEQGAAWAEGEGGAAWVAVEVAGAAVLLVRVQRSGQALAEAGRSLGVGARGAIA